MAKPLAAKSATWVPPTLAERERWRAAERALRVGMSQARVLAAIEQCGSSAYGAAIYEAVNHQDIGKPLSDAHVYVTLKRLLMRNPALIEVASRRKMSGSPPIIIYRLTEKGRAALVRKREEIGALKTL